MRDMSSLYAGYDDFNDFLIAQQLERGREGRDNLNRGSGDLER